VRHAALSTSEARACVAEMAQAAAPKLEAAREVSAARLASLKPIAPVTTPAALAHARVSIPAARPNSAPFKGPSRVAGTTLVSVCPPGTPRVVTLPTAVHGGLRHRPLVRHRLAQKDPNMSPRSRHSQARSQTPQPQPTNANAMNHNLEASELSGQATLVFD
jgi:hypothetical protein